MKAIMVMYDSLNRHYLPNYGSDIAKLPNFKRLGERAVTFDNSYVGSLPCMPARRELHTGRLNFLHRGWSPIEPFDDSMPELLKQNGVYTHLVSDHQHYWEDGGGTYHTRYSSWEIIRGQEGDPWKGSLAPVEGNKSFGSGMAKIGFLNNLKRQDIVNRSFMKEEADFPQAQTFAAGLEFIERNKAYDNWFLQIETFDPHEPFFSPKEYELLYKEANEGEFTLDWPPYGPVMESDDIVKGVKKKYLALLSMCDAYLGKVIDMMDENNMWDDTMLIVNTDHGFLLGEHLWWAKSVMPTYNELAHTPLFIWDPRNKVMNERRQSLVQTIDLAPTLLDFFGVRIPKDMQGHVLKDTIKEDKPVREYALFGFHGSHINITDGKYVYMRSPISEENQPLLEYTLMPTLMRSRMSVQALADIALHEPFEFTKGCSLLAIPVKPNFGMAGPWYRYGNKLYDLENDPGQTAPIDDPQVEVDLINEMIKLMKINDTPVEQYVRMGFPVDGPMTIERLMQQRVESEQFYQVPGLEAYEWEDGAIWALKGLIQLTNDHIGQSKLITMLLEEIGKTGSEKVTIQLIVDLMNQVISDEDQESALYTLKFLSRTH